METNINLVGLTKILKKAQREERTTNPGAAVLPGHVKYASRLAYNSHNSTYLCRADADFHVFRSNRLFDPNMEGR